LEDVVIKSSPLKTFEKFEDEAGGKNLAEATCSSAWDEESEAFLGGSKQALPPPKLPASLW